MVLRWEWLDKEELIKRIVSREFGRFLAYYADATEREEVQERKGGNGADRSKRGGKGPRQADEGYTRRFLNAGKIDGFYAKEVIGLINRSTKGMQVEVGKIDLMKSFTFVEVASEQAQDVIKAMKHGVTVKGRSVVCDVADKTENDKDKRKTENGKRRTEGRSNGNEKRNRRSTPGGAKVNGERRDEKEERRRRKKENSAHRSSALPPTGGLRGSSPSPSKSPAQQHHYTKDDWMKFLHPDTSPLKGDMPDFAEEGWARRKPKKKK